MFKSKAKVFFNCIPRSSETAGYFRSFLCGVISYYSWPPPSLHMCLFFIPPLAHCPPIFLSFPFSSPISLNPLSASFPHPLLPHVFIWQRQSCSCRKGTKDSLTHKLQTHTYRFIVKEIFLTQASGKQNGS